jgi:hypothetical protein
MYQKSRRVRARIRRNNAQVMLEFAAIRTALSRTKSGPNSGHTKHPVSKSSHHHHKQRIAIILWNYFIFVSIFIFIKRHFFHFILDYIYFLSNSFFVKFNRMFTTKKKQKKIIQYFIFNCSIFFI